MVFDKERSDKIGNKEDKRDDFLGAKLFNLIHKIGSRYYFMFSKK